MVNLSAVDLNLFVVLDAVLAERSATRAARRLNVTQSAVSNALGRLRELLGDPLVVRHGRGLVATPRAVELAPVVAQALAQLQAAADRGRAFDPAASTRTFTVAAADNHQISEAPRIAAAFARALPRASLRFVSAEVLAATDGLASGTIDLALVPTPLVGDGWCGAPLFEERACLLVRRDHPRLPGRARVTPRLFNLLGHIDVEVALGRTGIGHRLAQEHWRALGLTRRTEATVSYFTTAAMVAARTDLMAGLPSRAAHVLRDMLPLKIVPATFPLPTMGISMMWHQRTDADAGARHFRQVIARGTRI